MPDDTLDIFHPLVAKWFREQVGTPTDVARLAAYLIESDFVTGSVNFVDGGRSLV